MFAADSNTIRSETNIQSHLEKLQEGNLLPTDIPANRGPFRSLVATDAHCLTFIKLEQTTLKPESKLTTVPQCRKRLKTFKVKCNRTKQKVMFINTRPLQSQKIMSQYGNFLLRRMITINFLTHVGIYRALPLTYSLYGLIIASFTSLLISISWLSSNSTEWKARPVMLTAKPPALK